MSVANLKTKIMITAEEFFRNKIKEKNPNIKVVTLSRELITAEEGMRWAHEFKQLHLHAVSGSYSAEDMSKAWSEGYHRKIDEINGNELRYFDVWLANYR